MINIFVYLHNKNEMLAFATAQMEGFMSIEISQTNKDKYHMLALIGRIYKIKQMNIA